MAHSSRSCERGCRLCKGRNEGRNTFRRNMCNNGAERAVNRVSGSGAVSGHSRKRLSGSVRPRSGERVSQNRLER